MQASHMLVVPSANGWACLHHHRARVQVVRVCALHSPEPLDVNELPECKACTARNACKAFKKQTYHNQRARKSPEAFGVYQQVSVQAQELGIPRIAHSRHQQAVLSRHHALHSTAYHSAV